MDDDEIKRKIYNIESELKGRRRVIQALRDEITNYEDLLVKEQNKFNILENDLQKLNLIYIEGKKTYESLEKKENQNSK